MIKSILLSIFVLVAVSTALKIQQYEHEDYGHYEQPEAQHYAAEPIVEETEHHHEIEHKHATSHQSVKFHHHHPVPVYVKKEDQHLLKKPIEIGGTKQQLKIIHPETKHNYDHGLTLEQYSDTHLHEHGHYEEPHQYEHYEHYHH